MKQMRAGAVRGFRGLCAGLLAACIVAPRVAAADDHDLAAPSFKRAAFAHEIASPDVRNIADWIVDSGDNRAGAGPPVDDGAKLPFVILDKKNAKIFVFHADGTLRGAAPALLGLGRGDTALPGIGAKELSDIPPKDRVTPAGRFVGEIGADGHGEDVLWVDYDGAVAIHRVITTNPAEHRLQRLATPTPLDNRISWGCINVPVKFYEQVVQPSFKGTKGIVYVLPETKPVRKVFAMYDTEEHGLPQAAAQSVKFAVQLGRER
jgi:hypothetical protein